MNDRGGTTLTPKAAKNRKWVPPRPIFPPPARLTCVFQKFSRSEYVPAGRGSGARAAAVLRMLKQLEGTGPWGALWAAQ